MSIENEIAGLTQSTTDLLEAVNTKKSTLDTAVSNAQTAVTDATSQVSLAAAEKVGAQTARDTAESFKDQAYTYSQSAASAVAYQDLTAIAQTKVETARDVFVYDTSKDSDGGAWRQRTQGTSWYNETLNTATRGSRKEFPAVAVITIEYNGNAENTDVMTIYDGDDPSLPMWMVFKRGGGVGSGVTRKMIPGVSNVSAIHAVNGTLCVTSAEPNRGGAHTVSFINDSGFHYSGVSFSGTNNANIAQRNTGLASVVDNSKGLLVNSYINDVAMTVLPDAPIDPATGLPVPTIAVATNGGVSVIKDDGTVVDSNNITASSAVTFNTSGVWFSASSGTRLFYADYSSLTSDGFSVNKIGDTDGVSGDFIPVVRAELLASGDNSLTLGCDSATELAVAGLGIHQPNYINQSEGASALITSKYNTGWMNGDIKLATLSDTDDTDLVGTELVDASSGAGWAIGADIVTFDGAGAITLQGNTYAAKSFSTVIGQTYTWTVDITSASSPLNDFRVGTFPNGVDIYDHNANVGVGSYVITFKAITTTTYVTLKTHYPVDSTNTSTFDNVSVRLAEPDRSVNNNGLQVFGTVQKNPVATGADLVAYSGFGSSNYLAQPYNSDLDFGTGDFCYMGWGKLSSGVSRNIVCRVNPTGTSLGEGVRIIVGTHLSSGGNVRAIIGNTTFNSGWAPPSTNEWTHVCVTRKDNILNIFVNGGLKYSGTSYHDVTNTEAQVSVGSLYYNGNWGVDGCTTSLVKISGTAPTAEQIAKIYRDEKVLFQEGAQATLYGTSDAVTALAYDDTTELLHVGTSSGRSVFQGLKRVDNTTDAVGTAISASNNLVVEE